MGKQKQKQILLNIDGRYCPHKVLGSGAYGVVAEILDRETHQRFAVKRIEAFRNVVVCLRTFRELALLSKLPRHENIIGLIDIQKPASFDQFNEVYLIQELMPGDLHHFIHKHKPLSNDIIQYFTYQLLRGLKLLHLANIIHRDLKPSNILVDDHCNLKICDLGLSRLDIKSQHKLEITNYTEYVATRWYRAIEIMISPTNYSKAVDMWSVGCILGEMLLARPMFAGTCFKNQLDLVVDLLGNPLADYENLNWLSNSSRKYLQSMPSRNPVNLHYYFQYESSSYQCYGVELLDPLAIDLVERLLVFNPAQRLTVEDALKHPYLTQYHNPATEPTVLPIEEKYLSFERHVSENTTTLTQLKREMHQFIKEFR